MALSKSNTAACPLLKTHSALLYETQEPGSFRFSNPSPDKSNTQSLLSNADSSQFSLDRACVRDYDNMASRNAHKESGNRELPRKPSNIESLTVQLEFTSDYKKCHARKPYSKSLLKDCGVDVPQYKRTRIGGILAQLSELEYSNPDADGLLLELSKLAICNGHHGSNFRLGGRLYKNPNQLILERLRAKWGHESQTSALGQEKSTAGGVHHGFSAATHGMATCGGTGAPYGGFEVSCSTPRDGTTASNNVQTATKKQNNQDYSGTLTPTLSTPTYQQSFG